MSVLINGMEMPTERESFTITVKYNGIVLDTETGIQVAEAHEVPAHVRLIDADEFLKRAIGTKCFRGDYALMLEELVGESTTIIPAEESK